MKKSEAPKEQRCCLVTREKGRPEELIRFVVSPDEMVVPDLTERLPGRGMWLQASQNVLHTAIQRRVFSRAAQCQVKIPDNLLSMIVDGLKFRIKDGLGLARRAGQITYGFVKVREKISQNNVGLIIQATDGSEDEKKRLLSGAKHLPVVTIFTSEELGKFFGRDHIVHAAIHAGPFTDRLLNDSKRLAGFIN
ncbi:RNA-binding protein [Commensalibacter papalotli (ex Botero et al. 2024)]|uniref:Ribosomal protein L7Ae or related RNA K-turn-binding protein (Rpl7Ae) (PDB:4LCK) n=1 Tax=Commensalibacter papalotli (ex Botero et al. 2024) TaxID=2972766 RepID=A0ABM9HRE5_9PROT|nr:RNA-binding protein [Commensalibacter papalotli (ex Botero et al. 2024)]CAI3943310.1 Ribosomal protein L7Ae or related RNA K-turn-binding protein (Rpl7Ae) (PDB:4LCK) [Commensalibacter papalotli (ex Botero et al. 2024)]CAI3947589.1 Ribosomal protein L7Ae or related RNA K-turn-binding protein (Rpl7Ae) (PDB:4LCK) [Commensalibacter papalotli (ex Botero et al. 2024)]